MVVAIIPARYASVRLPGKLLLPIAGRPLIAHTIERARSASTISRVIVATDDQRIFDAVGAIGSEVVMTSAEHRSGTDRLAEVAAKLPEDCIIVNVQGDEPIIAPETIDAAVRALINDEDADMSTTSEPIENFEDLLNPNVVKVVTGDSGYAIYFSRSPIPFPRDASLRHGGDLQRAVAEDFSLFRKHTGLYVYRREYLLRLSKLPSTHLEKVEMLEQLRALEDGADIRVVHAVGSSIGVDTQEDYEKVRAILERNVAVVQGS
ncbi:MAG: 3-deoxy-manno-octulosonate cytidylyltransferase [Acidobacteria bacterium]|nr:MAG: 3-deoxy-manno-octulosonate cytidylyltransferase [Acidobacteriota bacterium]